MFAIHLILLVLVGVIGITFNWLLILAIQRKTYHYQEPCRISTPVSSKKLLQANSSINGQIIRQPLLPASRSSISTFDKYILAFLINDIMVCNFIIPLRFIDLHQGLPCGFFCFVLKFLEKLTTIIEIVIITLLLVTSLLYFCKKHLATTKLYFICLILMSPLIITYLTTTLTHIDISEYEYEQRPPSCKQTYIYINKSTYRSLNMACCFMTYLIIFIQFLLLIKMKYAIKKYKQSNLKILSEAANLTRNAQQEISLFDQNTNENMNRRSMHYSQSFNQSTTTSIAADVTLTTQRSLQVFDYLTYLTIVENSQTLISSSYLLLFIYLFAHIPYWIDELSFVQFSYQFKDVYLLCHILKPFCYVSTNENYRFHILATLQCKTFRLLPSILRRRSRVVTLNDDITNINALRN
ncbi:unnamed protein product [Rotaria magnacalcarata]|uniref:G-protein coupled receptors family 1 profile domain-containing protein n=3 Tax=Rotaria magnacalcarata TaxID=392030 RepID=A0A816B565_9BILA|nr:unnamed protein product [Rotaria magnacalcarata]CAF1682272.1 unnamed protein product [Rotaria magnacalcarata]CAF4024706.1 unnamed protein product [Rotaria magnacalcarata]CAF4080591.1 unnamed protein product [Rotaria magnacalcarata]CAF4133883.1 unnamed protein product [Rotaria magnacalcarata]